MSEAPRDPAAGPGKPDRDDRWSSSDGMVRWGADGEPEHWDGVTRPQSQPAQAQPVQAQPVQAQPVGVQPAKAARPAGRRAQHYPSPLFLALVAATAAAGWLLWSGTGSPGISAFVFVVAGWVVSLCLHEFAHAVLAYRGGDRSVADRGYLTLDPLKYTHAVYSIVLPLLFVLLGGIGLPGGAVFVDRAALRSRFADSAVSAAGPLTNIALALGLAGLIANRGALGGGPPEFWAALSFLTFLQVTAAILNSLPVPGLDGFGVIQPYLPHKVLKTVAPMAAYALFLVFILLWIPPVNAVFFDGIFAILDVLGVPPELTAYGDSLFRFWQR